jgi:hypothetical protein
MVETGYFLNSVLLDQEKITLLHGKSKYEEPLRISATEALHLISYATESNINSVLVHSLRDKPSVQSPV